MDISDALAFLEENRGAGTLVTLHADGRPQVSVVGAVIVDGTLWISATQTRVKTRNIRRDPRVVFTLGTRPWVAVEGTASIRDDETTVLDELRTYYRK
ncbi:MAG TPA: TIGR03618 family F420-dependent PPOX class oxidoreductase, partial [Actinomycetota bacterium]|nr:TIGR03618 family F420-dependent PPOX class oxidoreductase [Actinomycetota bacterium]